jgi:hypothetical protein
MTSGEERLERTLWDQVSSSFGDALELPASEREGYLRQLGSEIIASEVCRLLEEHALAGNFLETSVTHEGPIGGTYSSGRVFQDGDFLCGRFQIV